VVSRGGFDVDCISLIRTLLSTVFIGSILIIYPFRKAFAAIATSEKFLGFRFHLVSMQCELERLRTL